MLDPAINEPRLAACIVSYGHSSTDPAASTKIHPHILGNFGALGRGITPGDAHKFGEAVDKSGKTIEVRICDACGSHLRRPNKDGYRAEAAADAWGRMIDFLNKTLN